MNTDMTKMPTKTNSKTIEYKTNEHNGRNGRNGRSEEHYRQIAITYDKKIKPNNSNTFLISHKSN